MSKLREAVKAIGVLVLAGFALYPYGVEQVERHRYGGVDTGFPLGLNDCINIAQLSLEIPGALQLEISKGKVLKHYYKFHGVENFSEPARSQIMFEFNKLFNAYRAGDDEAANKYFEQCLKGQS